MAPFLLIPIVAAATGASFDWSAVGPAGTPPGFSGANAVFFSTILWNMQGWSEIGCVTARGS